MGKAFTKNIEKLDPDTFGNSKACHVLVDLMNQNMINTPQKHRVLSFITSATSSFRNLRYIPDAGVRERIMTIMWGYYLTRIQEMLYPPKFISYLENVIFSIFRKNLEQGLEVLDYE